jgi:hypothetical protein
LKRFEYSASATHEEPLDPNRSWAPEDLVLAGLVKCTLASLAFYSEREDIDMAGGGAADGVVTKLDSAEWGCFVGASLTVKPRYEWRVNGELVTR